MTAVSPMVSVIVPCYNLGAFVTEAVDSVVAQTYQDTEILVINDGSTDDTLGLLRREFKLTLRDTVYRKSLPIEGEIKGIYRSPTHPNLIVIDKAHAGKSAALNVGINLASVSDADFAERVAKERDQLMADGETDAARANERLAR